MVDHHPVLVADGGVIDLDSKLTFEGHIRKLVSNARRKLGVVRKFRRRFCSYHFCQFACVALTGVLLGCMGFCSSVPFSFGGKSCQVGWGYVW